MQLWLVGGSPTVQLVIILEWTKQEDNRVAEAIFPVPALGTPQRIPTTRCQLFGSALFSSRSGDDLQYFSVDELRVLAHDGIQAMGLVPA